MISFRRSSIKSNCRVSAIEADARGQHRSKLVVQRSLGVLGMRMTVLVRSGGKAESAHVQGLLCVTVEEYARSCMSIRINEIIGSRQSQRRQKLYIFAVSFVERRSFPVGCTLIRAHLLQSSNNNSGKNISLPTGRECSIRRRR